MATYSCKSRFIAMDIISPDGGVGGTISDHLLSIISAFLGHVQHMKMMMFKGKGKASIYYFSSII